VKNNKNYLIKDSNGLLRMPRIKKIRLHPRRGRPVKTLSTGQPRDVAKQHFTWRGPNGTLPTHQKATPVRAWMNGFRCGVEPRIQRSHGCKAVELHVR